MNVSPYPKTTWAMQNIDLPSVAPQIVCLIGQSNTANSAGYYTDLENYSIEDINTAFGVNQHISKMLRAFQYNNNLQQVKVKLHAYVKADNGSGVAATKTLTLTGTATQTGSFSIKIDSNSPVNACECFFDVITGDDETDVADAIVASINANTICPLTASNVAGVITLTAENKGTQGNNVIQNIQLSVISGITAAFTNGVVGATDPDFTDIITQPAVVNNQINFFVVSGGYTALQATLKTFLYTRSQALINNKDYNGQMVVANNDPTSTPTIDIQGKNIIQLTDKVLSGLTNTLSTFVFASIDEKATDYAFLQAIKLVAGANIAEYMINETEGKPANCALPTANTRCTNCATTLYPNYQWTPTELLAAETKKFTIMNFDGTNIILGNSYTLSNEAQFAKYENRQQFYICRQFSSQYLVNFFRQKVWVEGIVFNSNQTNFDDTSAELEGMYQILSGQNLNSIYGTLYAGILSNGENDFTTFKNVVARTLRFVPVIVSNVPVGTLSVSLYYTATLQIDNLNITQQNNLISA